MPCCPLSTGLLSQGVCLSSCEKQIGVHTLSICCPYAFFVGAYAVNTLCPFCLHMHLPCLSQNFATVKSLLGCAVGVQQPILVTDTEFFGWDAARGPARSVGRTNVTRTAFLGYADGAPAVPGCDGGRFMLGTARSHPDVYHPMYFSSIIHDAPAFGMRQFFSPLTLRVSRDVVGK